MALSSLHTTFGIPYEMFIIKKMLLTGIDYSMEEPETEIKGIYQVILWLG